MTRSYARCFIWIPEFSNCWGAWSGAHRTASMALENDRSWRMTWSRCQLDRPILLQHAIRQPRPAGQEGAIELVSVLVALFRRIDAGKRSFEGLRWTCWWKRSRKFRWNLHISIIRRCDICYVCTLALVTPNTQNQHSMSTVNIRWIVW